MKSARIAIFGMGRSGLSVAKAAIKVGANPVVFDERPADDRKAKEALSELKEAGVEGVAGWDGAFAAGQHDLVVTSPGVAKRHPKLLRALEEGIPVLSEIEFAYRIARAPIVAITGTNGKSTTTVMTWLCLKAMGADAVLCGNIYGSGYDEAPLTEAAATSHPGQVLVAEVSSFQLEWTEKFRPKAAAITNITPDHLNRYKSFEEYAETKRRIFANMAQGDVAICRSGDPSTHPSETQALQGFRVLRYGDKGDDAYETADDLLILGERVFKRDLPWSEPHNYGNAMCAALLAAAASQGAELRAEQPLSSGRARDLSEGLKSFRGLRHRMESLGEKGGVKFVNNSMCTNPVSLVSSSLGIPGKQRLILGGVNKGLGFEAVRDHIERHGHYAYLFGRDAKTINAQLGGSWPVFTTMQEAFKAAAKDARPGETVLLAPGAASLDQFEDFRARGEAFRKLAMEWLKR